MKINSKKVTVIEARDIDKAFREKYNRDINSSDLLFDSYFNDCLRSLNIYDAKADAVWDIKVKVGLIPNEMGEDEITKEYESMEIDLNKVPDGDTKDVILICDLIRECGIMDEVILVDTSW